MKSQMDTLEANIEACKASDKEIGELAASWRDDVFALMEELRVTVDTIECNVDQKYWPMPTYMDLLFGI